VKKTTARSPWNAANAITATAERCAAQAPAHVEEQREQRRGEAPEREEAARKSGGAIISSRKTP
jgi:hypothetical protein